MNSTSLKKTVPFPSSTRDDEVWLRSWTLGVVRKVTVEGRDYCQVIRTITESRHELKWDLLQGVFHKTPCNENSLGTFSRGTSVQILYVVRYQENYVNLISDTLITKCILWNPLQLYSFYPIYVFTLIMCLKFLQWTYNKKTSFSTSNTSFCIFCYTYQTRVK